MQKYTTKLSIRRIKLRIDNDIVGWSHITGKLKYFLKIKCTTRLSENPSPHSNSCTEYRITQIYACRGSIHSTAKPLNTGHSQSLKICTLFEELHCSLVPVCRKFEFCSQKAVEYCFEVSAV